DGARDVADHQVHGERRELLPVAGGGLPGIAGPLLQRPPGRANTDRAGDCWRGCLTVIPSSYVTFSTGLGLNTATQTPKLSRPRLGIVAPAVGSSLGSERPLTLSRTVRYQARSHGPPSP